MSKDLYVKNLSLQATEEDLRKLFSLCGKVTYIHLVRDSKNGQFVGAGYVKMSSEAEARDARVTLDGTRLIDRVIVVTEALPRGTTPTPTKRPSSPLRTTGPSDPQMSVKPSEKTSKPEFKAAVSKAKPVKTGSSATAEPSKSGSKNRRPR